MFGRITSGIFQTLQQSTVFVPIRPLSTIFTSAPPTVNSVAGGVWSSIQVRTNVRNNWPRPKETKRVKTHGWKKRMSTLSGRKIIMNRILKGRTVLSH